MSLYLRRGLQTAIDLIVLSIAYWLAVLIRFEFALPPPWRHALLLAWPYVLAVQLGALVSFRVTRLSWRYVSLRETAVVAAAALTASTVLVGLRATMTSTLHLVRLPYGVLCGNFFLAFVLLVAIRASRRLYGESQARR